LGEGKGKESKEWKWGQTRGEVGETAFGSTIVAEVGKEAERSRGLLKARGGAGGRACKMQAGRGSTRIPCNG